MNEIHEGKDARQEIARLHLNIIRKHAREGFIEVRGLMRGGASRGTRFFSVDAREDDVKSVLGWADEVNAEGGEIYVAYNARSQRRGTKEDVKILTTCYADLDLHLEKYGDVEGGGILDAALNALRNAPIQPHLIVFSGYGLHPIWFIEPNTDKATWAGVQRAIRSHFAEHKADIAVATDEARILRLVPYPNRKHGKCIETKILQVLETDPYTLSDLARAYGLAAKPATVVNMMALEPLIRVPENAKFDNIASIPEGQRNSALFRMGCALRHNGANETAIYKTLIEENATRCITPLDESEVRAIVQSCLRYDPTSETTLFPLTDYGNAQRIVQRHGVGLRFCHAWNKWLIWDGKCWQKDDSGEIVRRAKDTVRNLYAEASQIHEPEARKEIARFARMSESEVRIRAMIKLAASEPGVAVTPDELDAKPHMLNCSNGVLDLQTGILHPHSPEQLHTKVAPVEYDQNAACPVWLSFLDSIMAGNKRLSTFLQRAFGYSLTGDIGERSLFILYGMGANGKSTFLEVIRSILGEYAMRTPTETLMMKRDGAIPNDVARLKSARFVSASETDEGKRLSEALIKDLTGGDTISARFMRGEWFEFVPEFKIWLATNHKPVIKGTDKGIWDRIKLIPFEVRISPEKQDKQLGRKLRKELPGILAWAVRGCLEWNKEGLGVPDEVRNATEGYRAEMDTFAQFLSDCCLISPNAHEQAGMLYEEYKEWCERTGERTITQKAFGQRLQERGFTPDKVKGFRCWKGLELSSAIKGNSKYKAA